MPWLAEQDDVFEGALQTAWDRQLSRHPVLLLLLGSDVHMMQRLTAYDRPFYGRADNFALGAFNPAETAVATGLTGADAIDAHLVSGGLPGILRSWPRGIAALPFIERECADPASPLFSLPETALLAEFPNPDLARRVLETVGGGDRTHANIAAVAGSRQGTLPSGSLSPMLRRHGVLPWPETEKVGGWWNRQFNPEVDVVGADRGPIARRIHFVGSIKWVGAAFDANDLAEMLASCAQVPGYTPGRTGHVVVTLAGVSDRVDPQQAGQVVRAEDIISAWSTD